MYCEGNSDLFGFCIFWKREPPHPLELERSNSSAPSNDARFTQQRPSESYDANVSHFVLHTSSLISLLRGSVQVGQPDTTSGSCDTAFTLSVQIFFASIIHLFSFSPTFSLRFVFLNSSALVAPLPAFSRSLSLSSVTCFSSLSSLSLSPFLSVARGSWLPCWYRCLKLWGPRGHRSWKSPFPPTVQPVGGGISWETSAADKSSNTT